MTQIAQDDTKWAAAVLAAGRGTRMRTTLPKPLHPIAGLPIIRRILAAVADAGIDDTTIVRDASPALPSALGLIHRYVTQPVTNGTGGALKAVLADANHDFRSLLVLNADLPLITSESLTILKNAHESVDAAAVTFLTTQTPPTNQTGRVLRGPDGAPQDIVEPADPRHADAPPEANAGVYALDAAWARTAANRLPLHENGEYYITDLIKLAVADGHAVQTLAIDTEEAIGVNTLIDLAQAEQLARRRTLERLMLSGVIIRDPASTYIDDTVTIAPDTVIHPNTHVYGASAIAGSCEIGPDSRVVDSVIGERCVVRGSWLDGVTIEASVSVGPFARLRPGTHVGADAHIGSFGEIKESRIGSRTAMGHFGYVGDANIGEDVNIGAGAVTCNFDGQDKHRTIVDNGAFIGSGSMLVAPVQIGAQAYTAAGAVVTRNVAEGTTVAGVPAKAVRRPSTSSG